MLPTCSLNDQRLSPPHEATSACQLLHFLWEKPDLVKNEHSLFPFCSTAVKVAKLLLLVLFGKFEMTFVNITGLWKKNVCTHRLIILQSRKQHALFRKEKKTNQNNTEQYSLTVCNYSESSHLGLLKTYESICLIYLATSYGNCLVYFKYIFPKNDTARLRS